MSLDPQLIDRGTPNGSDGDDARTGAQKINENFEHLFETKGEVITFLMADNSVEEVVSRINTLPLFEIKYPASALIKATIIYDPANPPDEITTKIYKIVGRQGGNFGTGTTAVTTANLQLINTVLSGAEDFEADASTVVIDYGDLGTTTVIDHINALAPSETIAAPTTNLTIIKATVNSVLEEYLFIGAADDYGLNDTAITASDLQLIEQRSASIPLAGTTVGNPVTGSLEFYSPLTESTYGYLILDDDNEQIGLSSEDGQNIIYPDKMYYSATYESSFRISSVGLEIEGDSPLFKGVTSSSYHGANYEDNTYVQKKYVDDTKHIGTAVEDATVNTNQTIAPETNQSYFWNLTGNIDLTIDETTLSNGETVTFSIETTSDTNTETLTVTNAGANLYGSFDATKVNKITIEASKLATAGFKLNVFFNQPE